MTAAPSWFPFFAGHILEFDGDRVFFRNPGDQRIDYVMTVNDYQAIMELAAHLDRVTSSLFLDTAWEPKDEK